MNLKKIMVLGLALGLSCSVQAKTHTKTLSLTLKDAIGLALRHSPAVQADYISRASSKYSLWLEEWNFMPQYNLSAEYDNTVAKTAGVDSASQTYTATTGASLNTLYGQTISVTATNPIGDDDLSNPTVALTIKQPLLSKFGRAVAAAPLRQAIRSDKSSQWGLEDSIMGTVISVIQDYRQLLSDQGTYSVDKQTLDGYKENVRVYKAKIKAGQLPEADLAQPEASVAQQEFTVESDLNRIDQDKYALLTTIGLNPSTPVKINKKIKIEKLPDLNVQRDYKIALKNNPSYQQAKLSYQNDLDSLLVAEDDTRWKLDLEATQTQGSTSGDTGFSSLTNGQNQSRDIALKLTVPIDDFSEKATLAQAQFTVESDKLGLKQDRQSIMQDVISSIATLKSGYKQIEFANDALKLAQKAYNVAKIQLVHGMTTTFETLTLAQDVNTQANQVISSKISYMNDITSFYDTLGLTLHKWGIKVRTKHWVKVTGTQTFHYQKMDLKNYQANFNEN